MNPTLIGIIGIVLMVGIFMTRMPVAYVMAMIGFLGFSTMVTTTAGLNLLAKDFYEVFSSYGLTTVPRVGVEWSIVANVRSGRRTVNPRSFSNANACGVVTS